jgi:hypothetical protein
LIVHLHIAGAEHERHGNPRKPDELQHAAPFVARCRRSPREPVNATPGRTTAAAGARTSRTKSCDCYFFLRAPERFAALKEMPARMAFC